MDFRARAGVEDAKASFGDQLRVICSNSAFSSFLVCRYPSSGSSSLEENLIATNWTSILYRSYADVDIRADQTFFGHFKSSISILRDIPIHTRADTLDAVQARSRSSIAYSLFTAARQQYVFVMLSRRRTISEREVGNTIAETLDCLATFSETRPPFPEISERETECLYWAAAGKSSEEIALIMSLSRHTINDYLKSAMRKLKSINRTQAVAKATKLGVI